MKKFLALLTFLASLIITPKAVTAGDFGTCSAYFTSSTSARATCTNYPYDGTRVRVYLTCKKLGASHMVQDAFGPWVLANNWNWSNANCWSGYIVFWVGYELK